LAGFEPATC